MKLRFSFIFLLSFFLYSSEWGCFELSLDQTVWASSFLSENIMNRRTDYLPERLFDENKNTSWIESKEGSGIGEFVSFLIDDIPKKMIITNGFVRSKNIFLKNNRVKKIKLIPVVGISPPGYVNELGRYSYFFSESEMNQEIILKDSLKPQEIELEIDSRNIENLKLNVLELFSRDYPEDFSNMLKNSGMSYDVTDNDLNELLMIYGILFIKLEILEVYKGSKYDSTCLSEIALIY